MGNETKGYKKTKYKRVQIQETVYYTTEEMKIFQNLRVHPLKK